MGKNCNVPCIKCFLLDTTLVIFSVAASLWICSGLLNYPEFVIIGLGIGVVTALGLCCLHYGIHIALDKERYY